MKIIKIISLLFLSVGANAQTNGSCSLCKMDINDSHFRANAELNNRTLAFDATECLVNFLKLNPSAQNLTVADYQTEEQIEAKTAFYLKSKTLKSPMGANISAYKTEKAATEMRRKKGGEVINWTELLKRFESSKFGSVEENIHHHHHANRPDLYAPSGVMGDHMHAKGGKMLSFRYMNMEMDGNRQGSNKISSEELLQNFMMVPQSMTMQMYMLGGMYAVSHRLTLMAMQNVVVKNMSITHMMMMDGMPMSRDFKTSSSGLSDLKLAALIGVLANSNNSFHINTGLSIPLGSIKNRAQTPMNESAKMPYAMQLGSGTFDAQFGGTLKGNNNENSWGVQQLNTIRIGKNTQDYRFGNVHEINGWASHAFSNKLSTSVRLNGQIDGAITGMDTELMPMITPTAQTGNYKRQLIRSFIGFNAFAFNNNFLLSAELGTPIYQNNSGVFMNESLTLNAGLKLIL